VCDHEASVKSMTWHTRGCCAVKKIPLEKLTVAQSVTTLQCYKNKNKNVLQRDCPTCRYEWQYFLPAHILDTPYRAHSVAVDTQPPYNAVRSPPSRISTCLSFRSSKTRHASLYFPEAICSPNLSPTRYVQGVLRTRHLILKTFLLNNFVQE